MSEQTVTEVTPVETAVVTVADTDGVVDDNPLLKALHGERATVKELKAQVAKMMKESEKTRMESLSEVERAVEEARKAGYESAVGELRGDLNRSKITAAAASAGFADPADAAGFLPVAELDSDDAVAAAVAELAKAKPYLLKRTAAPLEQGVQGKDTPPSATDWIRGVMK